MTTSHEQHQESHHPSFMQYVVVAVILFAVTIVEFLLIWDRVGVSDDLGASKIPIGKLHKKEIEIAQPQLLNLQL